MAKKEKKVCECWVPVDPEKPWGAGRACRNKWREEYNMCKPCFEKKALAWLEDNKHWVPYFRYLESSGLL